jgi:hypothetical protein
MLILLEPEGNEVGDAGIGAGDDHTAAPKHGVGEACRRR